MSDLKKRLLLGTLLLGAITAASQTQESAVDSGQKQAPVHPQQPLPDTATSVDQSRGWLQPGEDPENRLVLPFLNHLVSDQKEFWTSPVRFRTKDLKWIVPFSGITAAFIASDSWWSKQVPGSHISTSKTISDYGTYSLIGLSGASFFLGHMTHDDHLAETGL